jgi:hypothetical protein
MGIWNLDSVYNQKYFYNSAIELVNAGYRKDGIYIINLPNVGPTPTFCLLDSKWDGGGWMLAMRSNTSTTFNYDSSYWTTDNTLNPSQLNAQDFDAKFEVMNKFQAKDIMARWPDILVNGGSIPNTGTWTWLENNFNGGSRQTLIAWFGSIAGNRRFIRDAKTFSGWANGVFTSQTDVRFYGFNYINDPATAKVRWGFGWNENGGGLFPNGNMASDDVSGGIGMSTTFGSYSAGDRISCCQDTTGINRPARVEVYVR